jgi:hypothetical protein
VPVYKTSNSGLRTRREYTSFLAGNTQFVPNFTVGAYDSIATVNVGSGGSSTITFSSIPATYKHLQIRAILKNTYLTYGGAQNYVFRCNSDTGSNYASHNVFTAGDTTVSAPAASAATSQTYINVPHVNISENILNSRFAVSITDILDYSNTNKFKTFKTFAGVDQNGLSGFSSGLVLNSGLWQSTSAITQIEITGYGNFSQYSQFALYGIKGD